MGMGKEIENFPEVKHIFDEASDILGYDVKSLYFEGPEDMLSDTAYSQPAIFTLSCAYLKILPFLPLSDSRLLTPDSRLPTYVAGHSLGEYTALVAAESLDFQDALRIVNKRASLMKEASSRISGGMVASLGLDIKKVEMICQETNVEIANLNSPLQIVLSGLNEDLQKAKDLVIKEGGRAIRLKTSGPFHSSWMKSAEKDLANFLQDFEIKKPKVKVIHNISGLPTDEPEIIKENLIKQITGRVRWDETIRFMEKKGITSIIEVGPGKVLSNLTKRITPNIKVISFSI